MKKSMSVLSALFLFLLSPLPVIAMDPSPFDDEPKQRKIPSLLDLSATKVAAQIKKEFYQASSTTLQRILLSGLSLELICKPIEPTTIFNPRKISVFLKENDKLSLKVGTYEVEDLVVVSEESDNGLPRYTFSKLLNALKDPNNKALYKQILEEETKGNVSVANYLRNQIARNLTLSDWVELTQYTQGLGYGTYAVNDVNKIIFSQEFSFQNSIFRDEDIYSISEIASFGACLTNIKLSRLNLDRLLRTESAAGGRLTALLQGPSLKSLDLSGNDLRQDFLNVLQKLSQLTNLNVEHNLLNSLDLRSFPQLTTLNVSWNCCLKDFLPYSCHYPENIKWCLTSLNVAHNDSINTKHFQHFTALTDLDMSYCELRKVNDLSSLTNLRILNLRENELGEIKRAQHFNLEGHEPGENMSILATLPNLTSLNVACNGLNREDIIALEPLLENQTTTTYLGKDKTGEHIIIGPHKELFDIDTQ
ncbi:MAG: hypothetical protein H0X26_06180 [Alphaproteobacteria bacterium]|nr:hypothetical protein [Alphaproteobacteria bacterium]